MKFTQSKPPSILIILTDQLRICSTPPYERQVDLPALASLHANSVEMVNGLATCPLCTPARAMLMTGRYPQTTGMIVNFTSIRSDEIGLADAFAHAGWRTGYVGKWHLHRGAFPSESRDWIPEGRVRLGWQYWRAYNCHADYWNGHVNGYDWDTLQWKGYETEGLLDYVREFLAADDGKPWLLTVAPHQPHWNWQPKCAPEDCYAALPADLDVPANVPDHYRDEARREYRHYMAMVVAIDRMVAELLRMVGPDTIVVFTSDHGTNMGAQAFPGESGNCWGKCRPHEENIRVPTWFRWPGGLAPRTCDELFTQVDLFPTLCGLAGIDVPRSVEGLNLSAALQGSTPPRSRDAALIMNFNNYTYSPNLIRHDGKEWRGVRTKDFMYARWREGERMLYDLRRDPGQVDNLAGCSAQEEVLSRRLDELLAERADAFLPYSQYREWLDCERRVIRNGWGPLSHPDSPPDWSLLTDG
ncbi:MAG: sulfatase-like hydrolase/transferase [Planctomycetes bacterium]|nr:sulfatase-like hydrolase/transferase [Planctomycetota bacterium]